MLAARDMANDTERQMEVLRTLFHRLNNQLGIVLANAELLESRVSDRDARSRASQVIESALEAMTTVRALRREVERDLDTE